MRGSNQREEEEKANKNHELLRRHYTSKIIIIIILKPGLGGLGLIVVRERERGEKVLSIYKKMFPIIGRSAYLTKIFPLVLF